MEKKPYHHKNLKNDLIEKGIELVNKNGINQLSLRKVAQACGVSHAAPYSHFSNKEELLQEPILRIAPNNKAHIVVFAAPSLVTILFIVTLKTLKMQETM